MDEVKDLTIIGAGPVGLFTAFYAGMRDMSVRIIDSMPNVGGQLAALYPEKPIYDVAGFPNIKAQALVDQLYEQAKTFSPDFCLKETVMEIERLGDSLFQIVTSKDTYRTRKIIISAGAGAFEPRKLNVESEMLHSDRITYFVSDKEKFKDKNVLICGGGDSAVDWALELEHIAKNVTLIHRRNQLRALESSVIQLENSTVSMLTPYALTHMVNRKEGGIEVSIEHVEEKTTKLLCVDEIIVNYGFITSLGPVKNWQLEIERNAIRVNHLMETNIPAIYAVGDICSYEGKPKLITNGFGEATIAVNQAKLKIDPKARIHVHSTHLFATANK